MATEPPLLMPYEVEVPRHRKTTGQEDREIHKSTKPNNKKRGPPEDDPPKKNRGSDLLSHPITEQYHQRKET